MAGGILLLVARGPQDIFMTQDPQITFFKIVYRRHTNFSSEFKRLPLSNVPKFGGKTSCTIGRFGDLLHKLYLVMTIPKISYFRLSDDTIDPITKFRWVRKIGYAMIKQIYITIGGKTIDRHYGDWLNIWHELTENDREDWKKMVGDIEKLYQYDSTKDAYTLYIPLQFWFCKSPGLALPLVSLKLHEVQIHVEYNDADKCCVVAPNYYIKTEESLVNYTAYENIYQTIGNKTATGQYIGFDKKTKRLYYLKTGTETFKNGTTEEYRIWGKTSNASCQPDSVETYRKTSKIKGLNLDGHIFAQYIYLDAEERKKFAEAHHEYLIETVQYSGEKLVHFPTEEIRIPHFEHPCKEIIWVAQRQRFTKTPLEPFNYSSNYEETERLITEASMLFNGNERISQRKATYFSKLLGHYYHTKSHDDIYVFPFDMFPELYQPSGSCNLSKINILSLFLKFIKTVTSSDPVYIKVYALCYNVLRISMGLGGLAYQETNK
jgi:hypothetical protein